MNNAISVLIIVSYDLSLAASGEDVSTSCVAPARGPILAMAQESAVSQVQTPAAVSIHLSAANHCLMEMLWDFVIGESGDIMEGWIGQTRSERDQLLDSEPEGPTLVSFDSRHSLPVFLW